MSLALRPSFGVAIFTGAVVEEPSARKIRTGHDHRAAFLTLTIGSLGLMSPAEVKAAGASDTFVSQNWLISTYLVLTFAELLLSPMGISFVSKVAPPKSKGMMMGCWFAATAIGNFATSLIGYLWGSGMALWMVWACRSCCLLSALFIFSIMRKARKCHGGLMSAVSAAGKPGRLPSGLFPNNFFFFFFFFF